MHIGETKDRKMPITCLRTVPLRLRIEHGAALQGSVSAIQDWLPKTFGVGLTRRKVTMDLKKLLKKDFGVDFPISGGFGDSRDSAIYIHRLNPNDYSSVEYGVLTCLGYGRRIEWKLLQQSTLHHNGRTLDQLKIETREATVDQIITQIENYYFDISECVNF